MALGQHLRKARESRKLTTSQVAAATHMKMQTVEAIEQEDFSRMPAAIYCKGFIKLYAEYMGMDPDPLTREYVDRFVNPPPPPEPELPDEAPASFNMSFNRKDDIPAIAQEPEDSGTHHDLFSYGATRKEEPPEKLFEHTPHRRVEDIQPDSTSDGESSASSKLVDTISGLVSKLKAKSIQLVEAATQKQTKIDQPAKRTDAPAVDTSPITLPNRQILIVSGSIAGVILVIFLISAIARFFTDDDSSPEQAPAEQELVLPVEPPPPYID